MSLSLLFSLVLLVVLAGTLIAMLVGRARRGDFSRDRSRAAESAQETWRTAVPWIIGIGALMVIVLGAYALTR